MKNKLIPMASLLAGVAAFVLTNQYLRGKHREIEDMRDRIYAGAARTRVIAARRDLPAGTTITGDDIGTLEVFSSALRSHAVMPQQGEMLLGRKTLFSIGAREPIFWSDIEGGDDAALALASMVKPGLRAISLSVSGAAAVSGMVRPNDRVDVLGTFAFSSQSAPGEMETVTLTVLQDVTVLATGQQLANQPSDARGRASGYGTVTLEVTPREAEMLVFAEQQRGRLTLSLRNPSDVSFEADLPEINFQHLETKLPELNLFRQRNIRHKRNL